MLTNYRIVVLKLNPDLHVKGGASERKSSKEAIKCHITTLTDQITEQVDVFFHQTIFNEAAMK